MICPKPKIIIIYSKSISRFLKWEVILKRTVVVIFSIILMLLASCKSAPKKQAPDTNSLTDRQNVPPPVVTPEPEPEPEPQEVEESIPPFSPGLIIVEEEDASSLNGDALEKAGNAREAAIEAGADKLGNAFNIAEQKYKDALAAAEKGDAREQLADVTARYNALENYANALSLKKQIESENLASYNMTDYNRGEKAMDGLADMFNDPNSSSFELLSRSADALDAYTKVLHVAYRQRAIDARMAALEAKRRADSVMAGVAKKDDYAACVEQMTLGDGCFSRQDAGTAYTYYVEAAKKFDALYEVVSKLREQAQAAMEAARKSVAASQQYAADADETMPITDENLEGIEDPDAVLIEVEEYADPSLSEANIPDTIEEDENVLMSEF